jgi:DNA-binding NtrC family response regulator
MPLSLQPKLLRVLQDRQIDRLGDTQPCKVNARVIATTNRSLSTLVSEGKFRGDLFYRLNVVPLTIPPLRSRPEDAVELAEHFLVNYAPQGASYSLSPELKQQLLAHPWPGNVRELQNLIRRALVFSTGPVLGTEILDTPVPPAQVTPAGALQPGATLKDVERRLFEVTLASTGGNRSRTAQLLGISIRTVRNKIREYGLQRRKI